MAKIIENRAGRRMIRLSPDDVFMIIGQYQQQCSSQCLTHDEARQFLKKDSFYLPEDL